MPLLAELFGTFAKIGLFTFGGGYAMIAMIEHTCVEKKQWITHDEMMDITVIAESTPGPIAINCATYTGYKKAGIPGAVIATLGIVLPSFLVIWMISLFLEPVLQIPVVANAFRGIKAAVGILILDAAVTMIRKMPKKKFARGVMVCALAVMLAVNLFSWKLSSIVLMLTAALVSIAVFAVQKAAGKKGGDGK